MLSLLFIANLTLAAPATAISVIGNVEVETGTAKTALLPFATLAEGAQIVTHEDSRTSLRLQSGSLVRLGPQTRVVLTQLEHGTPAAARKEKLKLVAGKIWAHVMSLFGQESHFEIETASAVAGVRGTALWAQTDAQGDRFVLENGALFVRQGDHSVQLEGPGASAIIGKEGLMFDGYFSPYALDGLRAEVGGPAAQLLFRTDPRNALGLAGEAGRQRFRGDINSPDVITDTPLDIANPADEVRGLSYVTVRVTLPTH